jgi:hypothetical protein
MQEQRPLLTLEYEMLVRRRWGKMFEQYMKLQKQQQVQAHTLPLQLCYDIMFDGPIPDTAIAVVAAAASELQGKLHQKEEKREREREKKERKNEEEDAAALSALSAMQALSQGYSFDLFAEDWAGFLAAHAASGAAGTCTGIGTDTDAGTCEQCVQFLRAMQ